MSEFIQRWDKFRKAGFLLHKLDDSELDWLVEHYSTKYFAETHSFERLYLFLSERNNRNAEKVAKSGVYLARVAVAVGLMQIILAIMQMRYGK